MAEQFDTALIVIDVLNPYEHEDAGPLVEGVRRVVEPLKGLVERAREEGAPVVYVNDNHGSWNTSATELAEVACSGRHPELVESLRPAADEAFVAKARHSIFYQTPLEYLLRQLGVDRIVLTGQVTEQCVLYSALDAYVRHIEVTVPPDAVASIDADLAQAALRMMKSNMHAHVEDCERIRFT